jgi:hypothetical protein
MPTKSWLLHGQELWLECRKAWRWVRSLPEYKADYLAMKERPSPRDLPGYTILGGPLLPRDEFAENLRNKWGLWPLIDPSKKMSADFFRHLVDLFDLHSEAGVKHRAFNYEHLWDVKGKYLHGKDLPTLPETISFSINPRLPIQPTLNYLKDFLQLVQKLYHVNTKRPRTDWLCKKYQVRVLNNLGLNKADIKESITPKRWSARTNDSDRQRIARIMTELKKVRK